MKKKKKIIIFSRRDSVFTIPLIYYICKNKSKNFNFEVLFHNTNFFRSLKILLVILLFGSFFDLLKVFLKRKKVKDLKGLKNVQIIKKINKANYDYGLSINYPKKIKLENIKYKIYNFHLGNLINQRGSFVFFYKYKYNWGSIDLTLHRISKKFDVGPIINHRRIKNIKKMNPIKVLALYLNNLDFLVKSIDKIKNRKLINKNNKILKANTEPKLYEIFSVFKKNILLI